MCSMLSLLSVFNSRQMSLKFSKYSKHDGRLFHERHTRLPHEMRTKCERKVEIPLLFTTFSTSNQVNFI